jgi:hypothetical protein
MFLFYPKVTLPCVQFATCKFSQILVSGHLRETSSRIYDVIALYNAIRHMTVADVQRREVPCITMGLCMLRAYKREAPINKGKCGDEPCLTL